MKLLKFIVDFHSKSFPSIIPMFAFTFIFEILECFILKIFTLEMESPGQSGSSSQSSAGCPEV